MEALLNYVSKRIDPSMHVGLTANNEQMNTRPNSARLIMAQEPVYDFEHKLINGITVK